jgi:iron complex outermembrane recepter protein
MGLHAYSVTLSVLLLAAASESFASNDVVPSGAPCKSAAASTSSVATTNRSTSTSCAPSVTSNTRIADARPIRPRTDTPAPGDQAKNPQDSEIPQLQTIMVTAEKRSENLQHVPIAITAFNSKELSTYQITSVADLAQAVPGFELIDGAGGTQPFIRGIGIQSSGPWQEATVATYIDGVYYESSNISDAALNNIAEVEVDKGPQGTLFGRNSIGGLVSYTTRDPSQTPHTDVDVGYGTYNTKTASVYTTGGITSDLAANLAVTAENQNEGWGTNLYTGSQAHTGDAYSARTKWLWTPGDKTTATWIADYGLGNDPEAGLGLDRGPYSFITTGPTHVGGFYDTYGPNRPRNEFIDYGTSLQVDHDFDWLEFKSISAVRRDTAIKNTVYPLNVPYLPATPAVGQIKGIKINGYAILWDKTATQEFQLLSPDTSRIKWVAGALFLYQTAGNDPSVNDKTSPPTGTQTTLVTDQQKTHSYSGYAQATAPLFAHTRLTAGIRYTSDNRSISGGAIANTVGAPDVYKPVPADSAAANPQPTLTSNKPTFKAGLDHDVTDNVLAYFSFSTGFQSAYYAISGGANSPPLKPETIQDYEAGIKSDLFDNRLRLNVGFFFYDMNNIIVSRSIAGNTISSNAAAAQAKGTDIDFTYMPITNLTLGASVEYIDPTYTDYSDSVDYVPNSSGSFNIVAADATGFQVDNTEKFMGTADASYVIQTAAGEFNLVGSVTYHSGIHYDTQDLNVQPPYALVNASVAWTAPSQRWDVKLWAKNLTNKHYVGEFTVTNLVMIYNPAPPLTGGVQFGFHF